MYFEQQEKGTSTCVLHALNNVLGKNSATRLEFEEIAAFLAKAEEQHHACQKKTVSSYYLHRFSKKGMYGGWSIKVVREWLNRHGIGYAWNVEGADLGGEGRFFVRVRKGHSNHALAVVDGIVLDSLVHVPRPWLKCKSDYRVLNVCRVFC